MTIDKKAIEEFAKKTLGQAYAGFNERPDAPNSCTIGAYEDLDDSGWTGTWYAKIKDFVRTSFPGVRCVCVNPIPRGKIVAYGVTVA